MVGKEEKEDSSERQWEGSEYEEVKYGMLMMVLCDREGRVYDVWISYEQVGAIEKFVGATPEEVIDGIRHRSGQYLLEAWNTMFQGLFTRYVVDAGLMEGA